MELRHIKTFMHITKYGSYSKAAQSLYLSQPAITAHVNELERELGVRLFQRHKTPVKLTEPGEIFLKYALQFMDTIKRAEIAINNFKHGEKASLSISLSEAVFFWILPYIDNFKLHHPLVDIKINVCLSTITMEKLESGDVDFGIIRMDKPFYKSDKFEFLHIGSDEALLVFSPHNELAVLEAITMEHISKQSIIIYGRDTNFGKQIESILGSAISRRATVEMNSSQAIKLFLMRSNMISFVPRSLVQKELDLGILVSKPIQGMEAIKRYSILLYRNEPPLSAISTSFLKFIQTV